MRDIGQREAEAMRAALKSIASYYNPAQDQSEGGQAAARLARQTLEDLGLFFEADLDKEVDSSGEGQGER
jgi:hypothetical protein